MLDRISTECTRLDESTDLKSFAHVTMLELPLDEVLLSNLDGLARDPNDRPSQTEEEKK